MMKLLISFLVITVMITASRMAQVEEKRVFITEPANGAKVTSEVEPPG